MVTSPYPFATRLRRVRSTKYMTIYARADSLRLHLTRGEIVRCWFRYNMTM